MKIHIGLLYVSCFLFLYVSCDKLENDGSIDACPQKLSDSIPIICSYQKYMLLHPVGQYGAQGSACYGDFLVQGYDSNGYITLYNLKDKTYLSTIAIPAPEPSSRTHVNTINFGSQRFQNDDYFPLLYISSGYPTYDISYIYVYRLLKDVENTFSISLVQTISLIGFDGWTEGIIDGDADRLWIKYKKGEQCVYAQYDLPRIDDHDVSICRQDCSNYFCLDIKPKGSSNQGHLYKDGKILIVSGVPSANETIAFISIDTQKEEYELILDLAQIGLVNQNYPLDDSYEPEGVIIYGQQLMICYRDAIYTLNYRAL